MAVSMHFFFSFFFLLVFVATSDGNLYPHASHLKYINVGESVGFQMSSALTLRIKHFSLCSSLSHSLREGQSAACCRHHQPFLCLFLGLLQTAPSQHKQIIIKFSASHPTPASPQGGKKTILVDLQMSVSWGKGILRRSPHALGRAMPKPHPAVNEGCLGNGS